MRTFKTATILGATALALAALPGCGGGRDVTPRALRDARRAWERAGPRDYDLEWTSSGAQNAHYRVAVRGGRVESIRTVLPDGREIEAHPAQPESFGIDGLFGILEEELAQRQADRPFGQPPGTTAVLRFDPDPRLGYPRRYRRDVLGVTKGIAIDVIRLSPAAGDEAPRPEPPPPVGR
ncbi:MAG TPA: DUF6174 domain-containing protein [Isosphaeraceae bacterium]|jgi:hypothetical protein